VHALRLEGAEQDAAVPEHDGVQRAADVEVADLFHVAAVLVHDEELVGDPRIAARHLDLIARAREDHAAAGQGARAQVVDAPSRPPICIGRSGLGFVEGQAAGVGRRLLVRQPHCLSALDVDPVNVGALPEAAEIEVRVVDGLPVERDERIGDGALAARDEDRGEGLRHESTCGKHAAQPGGSAGCGGSLERRRARTGYGPHRRLVDALTAIRRTSDSHSHSDSDIGHPIRIRTPQRRRGA
jgi:hypothetical protein